MQGKSGYWFAPITVRPIPELPDRVTVGLVFGNGRVERIEVDKRLERLRGLVSADHRLIFKRHLEHAAVDTRQCSSLEELRDYLGVQFEIGEKRPLLTPYSARSISSIKAVYFSALKSRRLTAHGLLRESLRLLDGEMSPLIQPGMEYLHRTTDIADLYPGLANRYQTDAVGPVRRAALGDGRHAILCSVIVRETARNDVDTMVQRVLRQTHFLNQLRHVIEDKHKVTYRMVGVLQPLEHSATGVGRDLLRFYQKQWEGGAVERVLTPATTAEATEMLSSEVDWVMGKG